MPTPIYLCLLSGRSPLRRTFRNEWAREITRDKSFVPIPKKKKIPYGSLAQLYLNETNERDRLKGSREVQIDRVRKKKDYRQEEKYNRRGGQKRSKWPNEQTMTLIVQNFFPTCFFSGIVIIIQGSRYPSLHIRYSWYSFASVQQSPLYYIFFIFFVIPILFGVPATTELKLGSSRNEGALELSFRNRRLPLDSREVVLCVVRKNRQIDGRRKSENVEPIMILERAALRAWNYWDSEYRESLTKWDGAGKRDRDELERWEKRATRDKRAKRPNVDGREIRRNGRGRFIQEEFAHLPRD